MSELKTYHRYSPSLIGLADYYLKSEADKVIAEKDAKIIQLTALIENYNRISGEIIDNANHQKYKRCLAMVKWLEERYNYLSSLENYQMTDKEYKQVIGDYWDRWYKRWRELAEKFKPNNSTAQKGKG